MIDGFTQPGNDSNTFSVRLYIYNGIRIKSSHCILTGLSMIKDSTISIYGEGMIVDFPNVDPVDSIIIYKNHFWGFQMAISMGLSGFTYPPMTNLIFESNTFINNSFGISLSQPSGATRTTDFFIKNNYFFKSAISLGFQLQSVPNNINIENNRLDSSRISFSGNMSQIVIKENQVNSASYILYNGSLYNLLFMNNTFGKNTSGVSFSGYGSDLEFYGNSFDSTSYNGSMISISPSNNTLISVNVKSNHFEKCGGIRLTLSGSGGNSALNINIEDNDFYRDTLSLYNPLIIVNVSNTSLLDGVNIINNFFDGGTIRFSSGSNTGLSRIRNLNISGNTIIGNSHFFKGIEIDGHAGFIENVSIINNIISKSNTGILLRTSSYSGYSATIRNVRVSFNSIFENDSSGIQIYNFPTSSNATIDSVIVDSNIVTLNGKDGIQIVCIENSYNYVNRLTKIYIKGNTIKENTKYGVHFYEMGTPSPSYTSPYFSNITYTQNLISDNGLKGIWIENFYDPNVPLTPIFPVPVITSVINNGGTKTIFGHIHGDTLCDYKIEVFRNNIPDSSGYGEGEFYIGDAIYTTDSLGFAVFQFPVTSVNSDYYSLTATSLITGNTSVFSNIGDSTVSLNEVDRGGVNVFPNPSNSSFNIISNKIVSLNVYDLCGKLILSKTKCDGAISFGENLLAGSYFLEVFNESERKIVKFVKSQ